MKLELKYTSFHGKSDDVTNITYAYTGIYIQIASVSQFIHNAEEEELAHAAILFRERRGGGHLPTSFSFVVL